MKYLFALFMLLFTPCHLWAKYDWNARCNEAYLEIIALRFENGKKILEAEKVQNPDNDIPILIENYIDQLTLTIGESYQSYQKLKGNKDIRLKQLENGDHHSPYHLYSIAEINLQWASTRIKFGDYFAAALEVNRAYKLLEKNNQLFPAFTPNKKSLGVLHSVIGSIPDDYKWAVSIIGLHGNMAQGVKDLHAVLNETRTKKEFAYLRAETLFILTFIELNLVKDEKSLEMVYNLITKEDLKNPLLLFSKVSICLRSSRNEDALTILENRSPFRDAYPFIFLDYQMGLAKLHKLDPDAIRHFEKFTSNFKGENYLKAAYQKIAWSYLLQGDTVQYRLKIQKVLSYGKEKIEEDKLAQKEAKEKSIPNLLLLKSRLLADGGYYDIALSSLINDYEASGNRSARNALEFTYRLARIYQGMKNATKAKEYHKITIQNGADSEYYFAANSALQLGNMYESEGNFTEARKWYEKAQNMKNTEYKRSISYKAEIAIKKLDNK